MHALNEVISDETKGQRWLTLFVFVQMTGGTIDIDSSGIGLTTKEFHSLSEPEFMRTTTDLLPDSSLSIYRRTMVETQV